jgi:hypothetical protein
MHAIRAKESGWSEEKDYLYSRGKEVHPSKSFQDMKDIACMISGQAIWYSDLLHMYDTSSKIRYFVSRSRPPLTSSFVPPREREYKVIVDKTTRSLFFLGKITGQNPIPDNFDPGYLESIYDQAKPFLDDPSFMRRAVTDAVKSRDWDLLWALWATESDIAREPTDVTDWSFFDVVKNLFASGDISEEDRIKAGQIAASGCDGQWGTRAIIRRWVESGRFDIFA